jgi:hypothetical protein
MLVIEERTHHIIQNELPEISKQLKEISGNLSVMTQVPEFHPKEDPKFCMDFDEWAARLEFSDRRRLMNFLWNDERWHATCLREEDAPWEDASKLEPPDISESAMGPGDDEDLPF